MLQLQELSKKSSVKFYAFQEEVGESGTPHIQGYMEFHSPRRFTTWKNQFPTIHLERTRGNRDQNVRYCTDPKKRNGGAWCTDGIIIDPLEGLEVHKWQLEILDIIKGDGNDRLIHWYWSYEGGTGKSVFSKHLCIWHNALVLGGAGKDMKYAVASVKPPPKIIILDIPRDQQNKISYTGIEEVKNGLFFSPKYESKMHTQNQPHVICFANCPPRLYSVSEDRWHITNIDTPHVIETYCI